MGYCLIATGVADVFRVLKNVLCGYLAGVSNLTISNTPKKRKPIWPKIARYDWPPNCPVVEDTRPLIPSMIEMSNLSFQPAHPRPTAPSAFRVITPQTRRAPLPTWDQLKRLAQVAEHRLSEENIPKTEANMLLSMMAVLAVTHTPWSEVRAHLLGHVPNLTVDILQLQQEVDQMSSANLQLLPGEDALSMAAEGLSTLNTFTWFSCVNNKPSSGP
ncbi:PREDICTED: uncharacterized protein LOC109375448 [Hipposideros armiger]|uniref:Uncharacterized protein LOC109375448 n=1 Tax=Hipposideros armiger TaxID=186990 RepID=A0A8B7QC77_HIPAR|nr:PREDICTED: uncharacterized protein LOC109375448 [Hipposideros armiger]